MAIVAGALANWVMLVIAFSVYFDLAKNNVANPTLYAAFWAFGLMGAFISVALTPVGEAFFRFLNGCRRPIRAEEEKLTPLFEEVCQSANINLNRYELYISDDKFPNAFAMGSRTVCITRSLMKTATDEELQGVLAHELGHHVHKDPIRSLVFYMITLVGQIIMWGGWLVAKILHLMTAIAGAGGNSREKEYAGIFSVFAGILWVMMWFFQLFVWIPIFIGSCFGSRQEEYRADKYAAKVGYSDGLTSFLNKLLDLDGHPSGFMGLLYRTHPKTGDRIRALEDYEPEEMPEELPEYAPVTNREDIPQPLPVANLAKSTALPVVDRVKTALKSLTERLKEIKVNGPAGITVIVLVSLAVGFTAGRMAPVTSQNTQPGGVFPKIAEAAPKPSSPPQVTKPKVSAVTGGVAPKTGQAPKPEAVSKPQKTKPTTQETSKKDSAKIKQTNKETPKKAKPEPAQLSFEALARENGYELISGFWVKNGTNERFTRKDLKQKLTGKQEEDPRIEAIKERQRKAGYR